MPGAVPSFLCQRWLPHNHHSPNENWKVNGLWNYRRRVLHSLPRGLNVTSLKFTQRFIENAPVPEQNSPAKHIFYEPGINPLGCSADPKTWPLTCMIRTSGGRKNEVSFWSHWESEFTTDGYLYISPSWCNYVGVLKHILLRQVHQDKWTPCWGTG